MEPPGKDFTYKLLGGMPVAASAGDKTRKTKSGRMKLSFGLAEIKAKEARWTLNWEKYWKESQESDKQQ